MTNLTIFTKKADNHLIDFCTIYNYIISNQEPNSASYFLYENGNLYICQDKEKMQISTSIMPNKIQDHELYKILQKHKNELVIDMTGGFGRDSLISLYVTDKVITYEINPFCLLVLNYLSFSLKNKNWQIINQSSINCQTTGGLWLCDPMFPPHPKTAKSSKYMQFIQKISNYDCNINLQMLEHAKKYAKFLYIKKPSFLQKEKKYWQRII